MLGWGSIGRSIGRAARLGLGMRVVALTRRDRSAAELGDAADAAVAVAVGETVISLTPPCSSLLKRLLQGEGGAAE